jgi:hypothetical protein
MFQFYWITIFIFISSIDYKFQHHTTSGAYFGIKYQPGMFLYRLDESTSTFAPKFSMDTNVFIHTHSPSSTTKVSGIPTYHSPNVYTVVFIEGSILEYTEDLLRENPTSTYNNIASLLPT